MWTCLCLSPWFWSAVRWSTLKPVRPLPSRPKSAHSALPFAITTHAPFPLLAACLPLLDPAPTAQPQSIESRPRTGLGSAVTGRCELMARRTVPVRALRAACAAMGGLSLPSFRGIRAENTGAELVSHTVNACVPVARVAAVRVSLKGRRQWDAPFVVCRPVIAATTWPAWHRRRPCLRCRTLTELRGRGPGDDLTQNGGSKTVAPQKRPE